MITPPARRVPLRPSLNRRSKRPGESTWLLTGVRDRASSVLALLEARTWPGPELQTLTTFMRSTVLRGTGTDAGSIDAGAAQTRYTTACADTTGLSTLVDQLEDAEPVSCSRPQLRRLVEETIHGIELCSTRHRAQQVMVSHYGREAG